MDSINVLLFILFVGAIVFIVYFVKDYRVAQMKGTLEAEGSAMAFSLTGFFVCFCDALGLGGFAPMTAIFKHFKLVKDRVIPGTLNTGMCIPEVVVAFIFIKTVAVDPLTLVSMLIAAVLGGILGSGIVSKLDEKKVQLGLATAMILVLVIMLAGQLGLMPSEGTKTGLTGVKLVVAVIGNFVLGALMTLGIGLYAPCMAMLYALGLSPLAAFPIMMGSCAVLMPASGIRFIKEGAYNRRGTLIIAITGAFGVIVAVFLVKSLPLNALTWLVMGVIGYTAIKLFLSSKSISR
ncbi:MAG: sulfite exporter TauE/SafE family protein [Parachlamydiales bacterium]|nr:sulfite exporter TauE/SafE family protein [Parachlamydiales bacterium]